MTCYYFLMTILRHKPGSRKRYCRVGNKTANMENVNFKPNSMTFNQGADRVKSAIANAGIKMEGKIITSRDKELTGLLESLEVKNIPSNFKKWQLPFIFDRSQLYVSVGAPEAKVPEHSHDEGDGIRFIVSGSINYKGLELTAGDWMFIPKGSRYSFDVGRFGATMFYCYSCCCA
jgi:hypothetical protein